MNHQVINYLHTNKDQYPQEVMVKMLSRAGHSNKDIKEAIAIVYQNHEIS